MITSASGGTDLQLTERHNVLAIMLFDWTDRLHTGPNLGRADQFTGFWLRNYQP